MIKQAQIYFSTIPAVFIDGMTYVLIAWFGAWVAVFATDEAGKWIAPQLLFWLKAFCGSSSAGLLSLKMYRSTSFADHQQEKKDKADALLPKQTPTKGEDNEKF